jgi:hypothetical protein
MEIIEDMLAQGSSYDPQQLANFQIKKCSETMFIARHRDRGGKNN